MAIAGGATERLPDGRRTSASPSVGESGGLSDIHSANLAPLSSTAASYSSSLSSPSLEATPASPPAESDGEISCIAVSHVLLLCRYVITVVIPVVAVAAAVVVVAVAIAVVVVTAAVVAAAVAIVVGLLRLVHLFEQLGLVPRVKFVYR